MMCGEPNSPTKVVYKIIYPNGKIYVGMDLTNSITYFGSASEALVASDFTPGQRRTFTVTREILWQSDSASDREVRAIEIGFILKLGSNDPAIGYNRLPRLNSIKPDFAKYPDGG